MEARVLEQEWMRTNPDYQLFIPDNKGYVTDNVVVTVFEHPQYEGFLALWTQSSVEGYGDNHVVISYSSDYGITWSEPRYVIGAKEVNGIKDKQASWGFPVVSKSGRIYLFYFRETDCFDNDRQLSAEFSCVYSDDIGKTWSKSYDIPMRRTRFDHSNLAIPQNNSLYQPPIRGIDGKYIGGYAKWTSYEHCPSNGKWYEDEARCYFYRFENLDEDPEPDQLRVTWLPDDENGVTVPCKDRFVAEEPCLVMLPNKHLFCTMRTAVGYVYYSVSEDNGHTWRQPERLIFKDGSWFKHPLAPCPIYQIQDKYVLFYHNDNKDIGLSRECIHIAYGTYDPLAIQPIQFDRDVKFMDLEGVAYGPRPNPELALYGSMTMHENIPILWYPDRKYFLLGKRLPE